MCAAAHGKLHDWKDFPKGLHILLAISDTNDCNEITGTLESCNYAVTAFTRGEDALAAIQTPGHRPFHAAMVDATSENGFDGFKILEAVNELPVIMISSTEDIGSMMRAITLGAADFLQKPFSEEKLRNIWQHVARKAMLENEPCEQEHPAETFDDNRNTESQIQSFDDLDCTMDESFACEKLSDCHVEQSCGGDLKEELGGSDELLQGKLEDLEEEFMNTNLDFCTVDGPCSIKLELDESLDDINLGDGIVLDGDGGSDFDLDPSIFVGFPDSDSDSALDFNFDHLDATPDSEIDTEEAKMLAHVLKAEDTTCNISGSSESMSITSSSTKDKGEEETKPERTVKANKCALGRKKTKVDWTPELHQKFVQAVEQLGVDKAIPSRILELMGVKCLTRHNIASHLQKYRSHRRHLLLREAEAAANWNHRRHSDSSVWAKTKRDGTSWPTPIQPRHPPILPAPPSGVPLVVWGHPTIDHTSAHMWQQPQISPPAAWQAPDGTVWQHPAAYMPPWGHAPAPVYPHSCMRVPMAPMYGVSQQAVPPAAPGDDHNAPSCHPPREVVDAVISEGLTNPCTLPLGLKPPSMESVMSELVRQGINITPPTPS